MDKRSKIFSFLLIIVLVITAVWGNYQHSNKERYNSLIDYEYDKRFIELSNSLEDVELSLSKSLITTSKEQNIMLLTKAWQSADSAQRSITQLPINHEALRETERFLNQLSDYCYTAVMSAINGEQSEEEILKRKNNIDKLHGYTTALIAEVKNVENMIRTGTISFTTPARAVNVYDVANVDDNEIDSTLYNFEQLMNQFTELEYSGKMSTEIVNAEPKAIHGLRISEENATEQAKRFSGRTDIKEIKLLEEGEDAEAQTIPAYIFEITTEDKEKIVQSISKKGGYLMWMHNDKEPVSTNLTKEEAVKYAESYIKTYGISNLELCGYEYNKNSIVLNFANITNNIIIYPETITAKVSLENGEILGINMVEYLYEHYDRDEELTTPTVSVDEIKKKLSDDFTVTSTTLAIIKNGCNTETLCYEITGEFDEETYMIFVNAKTGVYEEIIKYDKTQHGASMS